MLTFAELLLLRCITNTVARAFYKEKNASQKDECDLKQGLGAYLKRETESAQYVTHYKERKGRSRRLYSICHCLNACTNGDGLSL